MKTSRGLSSNARKVVIDPATLKAEYLSGSTIAELAIKYSVSVIPIRRILREAGTPMRKAAPKPGVGSGERNPQWKGGRRQRADGYILVWTPDGVKLEHRVVMEMHIGRSLTSSEIVHHKDGNPSNNSIDNLEIIESQSKHASVHGAENRKVLLAEGFKRCTICQKVKQTAEFYRTRHNQMGIQSWCKQCKNKRDSQRRRERKGQSSSQDP